MIVTVWITANYPLPDGARPIMTRRVYNEPKHGSTALFLHSVGLRLRQEFPTARIEFGQVSVKGFRA